MAEAMLVEISSMRPMVSVMLEYPGASPDAVENDLVRPIENVINTVSGVDHIYATAREGGGYMWVEFRMSADPVVATQEIRDKIAGMGADVVGNTPEQFSKFWRDESDKWAKVIRDANLRAE